MNILQSNSACDVSLESLMNIANATPEMDGGMLPGVIIYGMDLSGGTTYTGGDGSPTIQWYSYWYEDETGGTQQEINNMRRDLEMKRRASVATTNYSSTSNSFGGTLGWNKGFTAEGSYNHTRNSSNQSVSRTCCLKDIYSSCTHLPPCEAYDNM